MAEIKEVGKDAEKKLKKLTDKVVKKFKERPVFYTALGVVVVFALYKLFTSDESEYTTEEEVVTNAYVPVGYDGYPTLSDSMLEDYESIMSGGYTGNSGGSLVGGTTSGGTVNGEGSSYVEDSYIYDSYYSETYNKELEEQNEQLVAEMGLLEQQLWTLEQDKLANELSYTDDGEVYNALGELIYSPTQPYKVLLGGGTAAETQLALERESNKAWRNSVLQQMQSNSAAFGKATTTEEKNALYSANQQLGKSIGLTYNSGNGKWYEQDGSEALVYSNTSSKTTGSKKSTTTGSSSYGGVAYDKNTDYAALINKAKSEGASADYIAKLTAQRNAKIAGENLNADGSKKSSSTTSTKSGSSWGGKSTTTTAKTSSGKTVTTGGGGGSFGTTSGSKGETNRDSGSRSYGGVSYNKNTDYAAKINEAKKNGASQATINKLTAQRNAKIKGENLNSDGTKKK